MKSLSFKEIRGLLLKYNIPFCPTEIVNSKEDAIKIASKFGYPVVLKISSIEVLHKTDLGFVKTGIIDEKSLISAWESIVKLIKDKKVKTEGVLVQKELIGIEIVLGMKRNFQFGPVLMFGIGGVLVEILKDITFRIAPVKEKDVRQMFKEIKGEKLLNGYRGSKPVDKNKLVKLTISLSKLSLAENNIEEIDFNPVIVNEKGAWIVDARFFVK